MVTTSLFSVALMVSNIFNFGADPMIKTFYQSSTAKNGRISVEQIVSTSLWSAEVSAVSHLQVVSSGSMLYM